MEAHQVEDSLAVLRIVALGVADVELLKLSEFQFQFSSVDRRIQADDHCSQLVGPGIKGFTHVT